MIRHDLLVHGRGPRRRSGGIAIGIELEVGELGGNAIRGILLPVGAVGRSDGGAVGVETAREHLDGGLIERGRHHGRWWW